MAREVVLTRGDVTLRPLRRSDEREWLALRHDNQGWLRQWEANTPPGRPAVGASFPAFVRRDRKGWKDGSAFAAVIVVDGALAGRVSINAVQWGAHCGGSIGYWIAENYAGRGIVPTAVALLSEYGFERGLHRLEIALRPENAPSLRVAHKVGFRAEGIREQYLYIDGGWRDHLIFAQTADEPRRGPFWGPAF